MRSRIALTALAGTMSISLAVAGTVPGVPAAPAAALSPVTASAPPAVAPGALQSAAMAGAWQPAAMSVALQPAAKKKVKLRYVSVKLARSKTSYYVGQAPAKITIKARTCCKAGGGIVKLKVAGTWKSLRLKKGTAAYTLPKNLKAGKYTISARYRPSTKYRLATASTVVSVKPKPVSQPSPKSSLPSVRNFRDVAGPGASGYSTSDGRQLVKGTVYRSNVLSLSPADSARFTGLGITDVIDLRRPSEITKSADILPPGVARQEIDILGTESPTGSAGPYTGYILNANHRQGFGDTLKAIAASGGPVVFHCQEGKDRTGWTAALLLAIAEVPMATIEKDYLASNEYLNGTFTPSTYGYTQRVDISWLRGAFALMNAEYGSLDLYLTNGLGLDAQDIADLRARLRTAP